MQKKEINSTESILQPNFDNCEQRHKENSDTFWIPSLEKRNNISKDTFIKVIYNGERFWIKIKDSFEENNQIKYIGTVANDLIMNNDIDFDSIVIVNPKNIMDILNEPG